MAIAILTILFCFLIFLTVMTYRFHAIIKKEEKELQRERANQVQNWVYAGMLFTILAMIACIYWLVKGTVWEGHLMEWLNIVVRVMHITFGIAWIGASFYFVFLENALNRTEGIRDELAGNLWAVHGGGFYYLEKYKVAPKEIPKHLHWFKYEAYFTWVTGIALLLIVYYFNATALLVDTSVMKLSSVEAISIGIGSFVVAWILYDQLCKSPLAKKPFLFAVVGILILTGFAFFYAHVFSARAAFIHFGAMLGTLMVGNVFFVIIPSQKAMVHAAKKGMLPDAQKGKNALFRSISNNYFTFPVLFVMVSNHFPSTFGNQYQWVVLMAISVATAGIKHWLNMREQGKINVWLLPASVILLLAVAYTTAPKAVTTKCNSTVNFIEVNNIIQQRCVQCHSAKPTDNVYTTAPNGVKYDTPAEIVAKKDMILLRVVTTHTMPQNNKTNMTLDERESIRCWIEQGAKTQ